MARLASSFPVMFLPGEGANNLQPLWVEDLVTCLLWSLDRPDTLNETYEVGGAEYFSFRQALEIILEVIRKKPLLLPLGLPYLRALTVTLEGTLPGFPLSSFWVDYFAYHRTCAVDTISRVFGFIPARFSYRLEHLRSMDWARDARRTFFQRR
jgi:NADH dehydrogenase